MKPFKFSLQALLVLREQQEQTALQEYGKALLARERAMSAVRSAQEELLQAWGQFHERLGGKCAAAELAKMQQWCQSLERRVQELEYAARAARNQAKQAFFQLLAARQARAVLEKLSAKQKERHERARKKKEQKALDELANRPGQLANLLESTRPTLWN
jgi:flagellar export protein FliJ